MSPEQCKAHELTNASDQYSLGVVAYEMLTGHAPFAGSPFEIMQAHTAVDPASIRDQRPECPPELEAAVFRMMAKNPAQRYQSATKLLEDLRRTNIQVNPSAAYTDGFPGIPMQETKKGNVGLLVGLAVLFVVVLGIYFLTIIIQTRYDDFKYTTRIAVVK